MASGPDSDWSDTALFLTAGTVATGAIDHLKSLPSAPWVHVDAAWAGPLRFSNQYASLLDGVENADSVGFSAHKWMYQPKGAALVLFRIQRPRIKPCLMVEVTFPLRTLD